MLVDCRVMMRKHQSDKIDIAIAGSLNRSHGHVHFLHACNQFRPIGDVLLTAHKELEERTKSGLARATARAAEAAAKAEKPLEVSSTAQLRDLASAAARIFGWDRDKPGFQLNQQFVISPEQLEQIRTLRSA